MPAQTHQAAEAVAAASAEPMTPGRFREITAQPGDTIPLVPQLAAIPLWPNAVVSNVMTYATGRVFKEVLTQTNRTVGGRYLVCTALSQYYQKPMSSLLMYDEKAAALKMYGCYQDEHGSDLVVESVVAYDYTRNSYTITAAYGDGFQETITGSYSATECTDKSVVNQHGALFMTRETWTWPAAAQ